MMQAGLHAMLTTSDIQVVGMAALSDALITDFPRTDCIVIADELGIEELRHILENSKTTALLVLTNNNERILPQLQDLRLSGMGIVPLDTSPTQLQAAVTATTQGLSVLPMSIFSWLYEQKSLGEPIHLASENQDEPLTGREREVLELVSQGLSNKMIARQLQISEHTVKFHISSISAKLGASSRTEAVSRGVRRGLITL
jgi:DNA-binding NarL/FixJ family response regulator